MLGCASEKSPPDNLKGDGAVHGRIFEDSSMFTLLSLIFALTSRLINPCMTRFDACKILTPCRAREL